MKNINLILIIFTFLLSCKNKSSQNEKESFLSQKEIIDANYTGAHLGFDRSHYNFGKINRNEKPQLDIDFELENQGKSPLIITKTDVSCGCLSVKCPKEPILPGKKIKLTVHVDTKNQKGTFNKPVFIKSNADNEVELIRITGEIEK